MTWAAECRMRSRSDTWALGVDLREKKGGRSALLGRRGGRGVPPPANLVTTPPFGRGVADAAPVQIAQSVQLRALDRELDDSAEQAPTVLNDVGSTPTYDIHARVEPTPGGGQGRGQLFDSR